MLGGTQDSWENYKTHDSELLFKCIDFQKHQEIDLESYLNMVFPKT